MGSEHERALVISDDEGTQASVRRVLEAAGYDVRAARSGREGLRLMANWRPSVVLLGLDASGQDRRAFCEAHAANGIADIPVIVLGAQAGEVSPLENGTAPLVVADPLDGPDILAAVWVVTNP